MHSKIQINKIVKGIYQGRVLTQWWGHSLSINVTRDQFANPCLMWVEFVRSLLSSKHHAPRVQVIQVTHLSHPLSMFWRIYADSSKLLIIWVSVTIFFPLLLSSFAQKCKVMYKRDVYHLPVPPHTLTKDSHNTGNFMPSVTLCNTFLMFPTPSPSLLYYY